jgi:hypothetical protein
MAKETGTDLVVAGENSSFMVLRTPQEEIAELIEETLGGEALSPSDLDRVKVPTGGRVKWDVPTVDGDEETVATIEGVIIDDPQRRSYWATSFDEGNGSDPPDCASRDGKIGVPNEASDTPGPGGECASCPLNEFGTAQKGEGKACQESRLLFILQPDSLIPIVLKVPAASLANYRKYRVRLLRGGKSPQKVTTIIGLEKATQTGGNIDYARVTFKVGTPLDPAAQAAVKEYAASLRPDEVDVEFDRDVPAEAA